MNQVDHAPAADAKVDVAQPGLLAGEIGAETPKAASVEYGSGWYHDVAIEESEQNRQRAH